MKPYTLDEVEQQRNTCYPFTTKEGPIENTFVNVVPHTQPVPHGFAGPTWGGNGWGGFLHNASTPTIGLPGVPSTSLIYPSNYFTNER